MKFRFGGIFMVLLFNIICFTLLCFYPDAERTKLLGALGIICGLILATYIFIYALKLGDPYPFLIVAMLSSLSIIILYSLGIQESVVNGSQEMLGIAQRQVVWFVAGVIVFFVSYGVYRLIKFWDKLLWPYMIMALALFVVSLVFAKDNVEDGVKNWINIKGVSIQPSEFIKLCFCFAMAVIFSKKQKIESMSSRLWRMTREDVYATAFVYCCMGLFLMQSELGTAMLFFMVYIAMMVAYDMPLLIPFGNMALVALVVAFIFKFGDSIGPLSRALDRFEIWLDPEIYNFAPELNKPAGTEHMYYSLRAICSGDFFGVGLGRSGIYYLAAIESDLVFSAICYEMGIFMGFAIIMMYFILAYRGYKIAMEVSDAFHRALAITIVTSIALQAFIIIGGVTKFIPLTGITMPFVSAGGSSMVVSFAMLGILTAISHSREKSAFSS